MLNFQTSLFSVDLYFNFKDPELVQRDTFKANQSKTQRGDMFLTYMDEKHIHRKRVPLAESIDESNDWGDF